MPRILRHYMLIDMNTQWDFLDPDGAYPIQNRKESVANLRRIFAMARAYHTAVISSLDSHRPNEYPVNGVPRHCIEGTQGQKKLPFTLLRKRTLVEANNNLDLPRNLLAHYQQLILRRRTRDFLENPKADRLLSDLKPEMFILFGVGMEQSIKRLALALLARGKSVGFVPEACGHWNEIDADLGSRLVAAKGGEILAVEDMELLFKKAACKKITRVFSKPPDLRREATRPPRSLAS